MIRSIIIDNNQDSIDKLSALLSKFNDIEVINVFNNPFDSIKDIVSKDINVIFIELNLPGFNGFDFIKNLQNDISVVVTSDVKEYAIEAFELDVLDYLVKPITQDRFLNTITRIYKSTNDDIVDSSNHERANVYVKVDKKMIKIYLDQILYIESVGDYIKIVTKTETFINNTTLKKFTAELPQEDFMRVHRSYTISTQRVTALNGNTIEIGNNNIPVGRQYIGETKARIIS